MERKKVTEKEAEEDTKWLFASLFHEYWPLHGKIKSILTNIVVVWISIGLYIFTLRKQVRKYNIKIETIQDYIFKSKKKKVIFSLC